MAGVLLLASLVLSTVNAVLLLLLLLLLDVCVC
jgi:hypothetical protein